MTTRLVSAFFLLLFLGIIVAIGQKALILFILALIFLASVEVLVFFLKYPLWSPTVFFFSLVLLLIQVWSYISFDFFTPDFLGWMAKIFTIIHLVGIIFLWYPPLSFLQSYSKQLTFPAKKAIKRIVATLFCFYWAIISLLFLYFLSKISPQENMKLFLSLLASAYLTDSFAWFFGKTWGKRPLISLSPKKTWEGFLGGILSTAIALGLLHYKEKGSNIFIIFLALAILSQAGDLLQSKLKRLAGIKDSSFLIPGHGGVYDRLDSLIYILPFYCYTFLKN